MIGSELIDDGLRDTLTRWGEQVHRVFTSANLNLFAGTGVPASPETHIAAVLSNTSLEGLRDSRDNSPPLSERQVLDEWLLSKAGPLLVLAPFGTGKSVLLRSFTIMLAERLRRLDGDPNDLQVPVPVRLREWVRFRAAHRRERATDLWIRFLLEAVRDFTADPEVMTLTYDEFIRIKRRGSLVLLLDGFDELPAISATDNDATSRSEVLELIRPFAPQFILTSRNYYEAERDRMFSAQAGNILKLRELERPQILDYVHRYFAREEDARARESAVATLDCPSTALEDFLTRPLFLAAWCEQVPRDGSRPTTSVGDVMLGLFRGAIRQRQHTLAAESGLDAGTILIRAEHWADRVGGVLCACAHARYSDNLTAREIAQFQSRWLADNPDPDLTVTLRVATALGLLVRVGSESLWCPKVPLAEFLVGKYLSGLGTGPHICRRAFIQLLRRWAYRSETFESLEFAFELLTHAAGSAHVEPLLDWMCRVSDAEPHRARARGSMPTKTAADDLVRPVAWLAIRLAVRSAPQQVAQCARSCALAVTLSRDSSLRFPPRLTLAAAVALTEALARRYAAAQTEQERENLEIALNHFGVLWVESHARAYVEQIMALRSAACDDPDLWHALNRAAYSAGIQVPFADAQSLVERLIVRYGREEPDEEYHRTVAGTIAMKVRDTQAVRVIERWVRRWRDASDRRERRLWEEVARHAAISVDHPGALDTVMRWFAFAAAASTAEESSLWRQLAVHAASQIKDATIAVSTLLAYFEKAPSASRYTLLGAIPIVLHSGRLDPASALSIVGKLFSACVETTEDLERNPLRQALAEATKAVAPPEALEELRLWMQRLEVESNTQTQITLYGAIAAAAELVAAETAVELTEQLIALVPKQHWSLDKGKQHEAWDSAVTAAASRIDVRADELLPLLQRWLRQWLTDPDRVADGRATAIDQLTRRLDSESAVRLTEQLITGADLNPQDKQFPSGFVLHAARSVASDSVAWTFARWLKRYDTETDPSRRPLWKQAALAIVGRVDVESAPAVLDELVRRHQAAADRVKMEDYRTAISRVLGRQPRSGDASTPHALRTLLSLRVAADSRCDFCDEREYWDSEIKALVSREFRPEIAEIVCGILLTGDIVRPEMAILVAIKVDALVLWAEGKESALTLRKRGDDNVLLDPGEIILNDPEAQNVFGPVREIIDHPFQTADCYTPDEQYQRLTEAIRRMRPELTGYPDGPKPKGNANKRNAWVEFFRDQLTEGTERYQEKAGTHRWMVLRSAFDRLLLDTPLLKQFIASRDSLRPKRPR